MTPPRPDPDRPTADPDRRIVRETQAWVRHAVVGLNLCPFAKAPMVKDQIRYVVCDAGNETGLLAALETELATLAETDLEQVETTLLIHPNLFADDFLAFNDFLDAAEAAVEALGHGGVFQIASFHPHYQFAGTAPDELGNATNRSPYPTLQLLRESSVARAIDDFSEAEAIFEANVRRIEALGTEGWAALRARCRADATE